MNAAAMPRPLFAMPCHSVETLPPAVAPLVAVLRQLEDLVRSMTDAQYRGKPAGFSSNVGGHVRHCLDHVAALLSAVERGELDYDQRQRGTEVETNRQTALDALDQLAGRLLELPGACEKDALRLRAIVSPALPPVEADTSVGRELAFVLSHTIHHNALVGVIAAAVGAAVPERFGYAPATLAYLEKAKCVR